MDIKTTLKASVAAGALLALAAPMQTAEAGKLSAGNSKIDVTWGGRVHRAVRFVDDGAHDGLFQTDGTSSNSEVWFSGSGALTESVTMGALLRWDVGKNNGTVSFGRTTGDQTLADDAFTSKYETIYFKHKAMGTLTIGQWDQAAAGAPNLGYANGMGGGGGGTHAGGFEFTTTNGAFSGTTVGAVFSDIDPSFGNNVIRYDSPSFSGFGVAASLAGDSATSAKLSYSGSFSGVSVKAAIAYHNEEANGDWDGIMGSIAAKHSSGLSARFGYGKQENSLAATLNDPEYKVFGVGYAAKLSSLGTTTFAVNYHNTEDNTAVGDDAEDLTVSIVQSLDSVGGRIGIEYSRIEYTDSASNPYNDIDVVYFETGFNF